MKSLISKIAIRGVLAMFLALGGCASKPKPVVYSGDTYNPEKAEAFTLNFFLSIKRASAKDMAFDVSVFNRETGKDVDITDREIKVYSKNEKNLQVVEKTGKNDFRFHLKNSKLCWEAAIGFVIEDPRPAMQKTTISLIPLCEASL
ncbi:MAG: hypothetical protein ABIR96_07060 [Bdellovibrionota bacterium]